MFAPGDKPEKTSFFLTRHEFVEWFADQSDLGLTGLELEMSGYGVIGASAGIGCGMNGSATEWAYWRMQLRFDDRAMRDNE
ncbi:hypothetical protein [Prosthecobacter debontii]|uniref:hypothetical protein n=1 Tax=Prosthecobacter debontii TaxID=48467 RepID=UPI00099AF36D|nr:hypothetical protein [Prosthecobacter debontii]